MPVSRIKLTNRTNHPFLFPRDLHREIYTLFCSSTSMFTISYLLCFVPMSIDFIQTLTIYVNLTKRAYAFKSKR